MEEKETLFTQDTIDFIEAHEDTQLNNDIMEAIIETATGENDKGDTRKTMIAIAAATAVFLKMCAENATSDTPLTALDYSKVYGYILNFYCMKMDHPIDEEKNESNEQAEA